MSAAVVVRAAGMAAVLLVGMVHVPAGDYLPVRGMEGNMRMPVGAFDMDAQAVTREQYLAFVQRHAEWQKGKVIPKFAEASYLDEWSSALNAGDAADLREPVTSVSWYAAKAYCEAEHKRLPTTAEWEYVAAASETNRDATRDPVFMRRLLAMYASRRSAVLAPVGQGFRNVYGIEGLQGGASEWTEDFRPDAMTNCAGAAMGASDATNYPALLRESFRSALTERSTVRTLGFRCAR